MGPRGIVVQYRNTSAASGSKKASNVEKGKAQGGQEYEGQISNSSNCKGKSPTSERIQFTLRSMGVGQRKGVGEILSSGASDLSRLFSIRRLRIILFKVVVFYSIFFLKLGMYNNVVTSVQTNDDNTYYFPIKIELYQG